MKNGKRVVLSGIRATGRMHIGNYLGVLEQFARLSKDPSYYCYFFIADLHTLTTHKESALISRHAPDIVLDMLAAGIDAERASIYVQSHVPVVTELAWYLACLTPHGELERVPTFKDKAAKQPDDVNGGLYLYPVLMMADILGPRANLVPVGQDQKPHLELTREIARKFNRLYGNLFPIPDDLGEEMMMVPGLVAMGSDGRFNKMGKSEAPEQTIYLNDDSTVNRDKILRAPTDPARARRTDPGTPEKCAIYHLHTLVGSGDDIRWVSDGCRTATLSCVNCKTMLAKNIDERLREFHERRAELVAVPKRINELVAAGDARARAVFEETTAEVAERMGVFRAKRS